MIEKKYKLSDLCDDSFLIDLRINQIMEVTHNSLAPVIFEKKDNNLENRVDKFKKSSDKIICIFFYKFNFYYSVFYKHQLKINQKKICDFKKTLMK